MKKENINNKLTFKKVVVTELNDNQLLNVQGGAISGRVCDLVISIIGGVNDVISMMTKPML